MKITLSPEIFSRLKQAADAQGVSVITYVKNLIKLHLETL